MKNIGGPKNIKDSFYCYNNNLVSLEGAPQEIGRDFYCDPLPLRGCPINLLAKISFYEEGESIRLKNYIRETIDGLVPDIYFRKMI
jgi:hypothetical protein